MKHLIPAAFLALSACATAPEPIADYNAPYLGGKGGTPPPQTPPVPPSTDGKVKCPVKSPMPWKMVKPGHQDVLCYGDPTEPTPEPKEQPKEVECTDAGKWLPNTQYALGGGKQCA